MRAELTLLLSHEEHSHWWFYFSITSYFITKEPKNHALSKMLKYFFFGQLSHNKLVQILVNCSKLLKKKIYCINVLFIPSIKKLKFSLFFLSCTYASSHPLLVLSSLSLAPLSFSFPCGFSSLLVVAIRIEIEFGYVVVVIGFLFLCLFV